MGAWNNNPPLKKSPLYTAPGATRGMVQPGNIDLQQLPAIDNGDGSWSTVNSTSFTDEDPKSPTFGKEVLVRGILNGKRVDPRNPAIAQALRDEYRRTGQHLGVFDNGDNADEYAQRLHNDWEANKIPGLAVKPPAAKSSIRPTQHNDSLGKPQGAN